MKVQSAITSLTIIRYISRSNDLSLLCKMFVFTVSLYCHSLQNKGNLIPCNSNRTKSYLKLEIKNLSSFLNVRFKEGKGKDLYLLYSRLKAM